LIVESDPEMWLRTLQVNTLGAYLTCRAFVGGMIAAGWGRVVNLSSAAALHPPGPLTSAYNTSKIALNAMTRSLAAELAGTGVTANMIHPGDLKTDMWRAIRDAAGRLGPEAGFLRDWVDWVDRTGGDPPEKAAALVLRLLGEDAATINGQFLWIEGGLQAPGNTPWT
jgi:NAD(P)-dependent dehydrogenase (short-subunit alcohol dehydrogenase family)